MKARGKDHKSVADLKQGESGVIKRVHQSEWALKLLELGCLPGTEVSLSYRASVGGTVCIELSGHKLSLRKEEARSLKLVE